MVVFNTNIAANLFMHADFILFFQFATLLFMYSTWLVFYQSGVKKTPRPIFPFDTSCLAIVASTDLWSGILISLGVSFIIVYLHEPSGNG